MKLYTNKGESSKYVQCTNEILVYDFHTIFLEHKSEELAAILFCWQCPGQLTY